tara:strand:+ start:227 stop:577 length:351 start_codon:yes stop_codon:yes gene_type:complete
MSEGKWMSKAEINLLIQYALEKHTITEISRRLGYSRQTIYNYFDTYGIQYMPQDRDVTSISTLSPVLAQKSIDLDTLKQLKYVLNEAKQTIDFAMLQIEVAEEKILTKTEVFRHEA